VKKINGEEAKAHYEGRKPEYATMSRGAGGESRGIGYGWLKKYGDSDVFPHDEVIARGHASKPPRYYDKVLKDEAPEAYEALKQNRLEQKLDEENLTPRRLRDRETVTKARMRHFNTRENQ